MSISSNSKDASSAPPTTISGKRHTFNDINHDNMDMDDIVPTVFRWKHGGRSAYIIGTFNSWERPITMQKSGNDFFYVHNLVRGKHAFKFVIDDEWLVASDLQTAADDKGNINNFIDVTTSTPYTGDDEYVFVEKI